MLNSLTSFFAFYAWILIYASACGLLLDPSRSTETEVGADGTSTEEPGESDSFDTDLPTASMDERLVVALSFNGSLSDLEDRLSDLEFDGDPLGEEDGRKVFFADESSLLTIDASEENSSLDRFTVELWVKPSTYPGPEMRFALADKQKDWGAFLHDDKRIRFAATGGIRIECDEIVLNQWHHIVLAVDRQQQEARGYLNGSLCGEIPVATEPESRMYNIHIGSNSPDGLEKFIGSIDLFRLWNEPLSEQEICSRSGQC